MTEFYSLMGQPAQLETFFCAPFQTATRWISNDQELLIQRILQSVAGLFMALLALPLKLVGIGINLAFRERMTSQAYETEFQAWNQIFFHYHDSDLGPSSLLKGEEDLINQLIRARVKTSDCKYKQILLNVYGKDSHNMFNPDGRYSLFSHYYVKNKCLFIGCSSNRETLSLLGHKFDPSHLILNGDFKKYILDMHQDEDFQKDQNNVDCLWCEAEKLPQQVISFLTEKK